MKRLFDTRPILATAGVALTYLSLVGSLLLVIYKMAA